MSAGLAARIALACLGVAVLAIAIVAVGVVGFGEATFQRLMVEHGESVADAQAMFESSVTSTLAIAGIAALLASVALAAYLGRRLALPLRRIASAARRLAEGDFGARAPASGPAEIRSLADSFNQMADRLEEHELMRREFIANAAHELRTPLTNLQGYLEALRDGVMSPDRAMFESLHEEADRLVRLSHSLEALAEGDLALGPPRLGQVDVASAVGAAVAVTRPAFERRRLRVEIDVPATAKARANADHLAQVLANLLQNAVRYTPEGGDVRIAVTSRRDDVLVTVTNSGAGIPARDLPHVFERFYRVEKSRDRGRGGAGIGLAIVKRLVEIGGGRVGAESSAGLTRFWFTLPA